MWCGMCAVLGKGLSDRDEANLLHMPAAKIASQARAYFQGSFPTPLFDLEFDGVCLNVYSALTTFFLSK